MEAHTLIARDIDDATKVEGSVQYREALILRHIDFIQDAETAALCRAEHRSLPELYRTVPKGIRTD